MSRRLALGVLAAWGIGVIALAVTSSAPGAAMQSRLPSDGQPGGPLAALARAIGLTALHGNSPVAFRVVIGGVLAAAFLVTAASAWRGSYGLRLMLALAVGANLLMLMTPLLASRDVYSYVATGRMQALHGANPYVSVPSDYPDDSVTPYVGTEWHDTTSPYGPAFAGLAHLVATMSRSVGSQVQVYRLIACAAAIITTILVAFVATRWDARLAPFAVCAFGMNPAVLFGAVAGGHNDLLVALAVAAALALLTTDHELLAVAALTIGGLVKAPALIPAALLIVWAMARAPRERRVGVLLTRAGLVVAIALAAAIPYLQGTNPSLGITGIVSREAGLGLGGGAAAGGLQLLSFSLVLGVSLIVLGWALWRRGGEATVPELGAAWGWALLLLTLPGTTLFPWYVAWALPLAWLLPRVPRWALLATAAVLTVSQWVAEAGRYPDAFEVSRTVNRYVLAPLVLALLVWLLIELYRRASEHRPPWDPTWGCRERGSNPHGPKPTGF